MRVLFFGRYNPDYSRNAVLMKGLRLNGVEVLECRVAPSARFWPLRLVWRYLRSRPRFDIMLVAFPGQEVMLLARWLTLKPIVFDGFTSHYEGYVEDRKVVRSGTMHARWYAFLDWAACWLATSVLTDTRAHAEYYTAMFGVPKRKLIPILLGTMISPEVGGIAIGDVFTVHFHGSNVPLQGIDIIWGAIRRLWNEDIRFQMIGPFEVPNELRNRIIYEKYVPFGELAGRMRSASVCLGIFSGNEKAKRVIPNKVFEALAIGCPVITADTPAIRELLTEEDAVLVRASDADELAMAIVRIRDENALRIRLSRNGFMVLTTSASITKIGSVLEGYLKELI